MELYGKAPFTRPVSLLDLNSLTGFCLFCFVYLSVSVFSASQRVQSFLVVRARIPRNRTRLISAFVLSSLPSYPSRYLFPNFPQISPSDPLDFFCPLARFSSHFFWLSQWSPVSIRFSPPHGRILLILSSIIEWNFPFDRPLFSRNERKTNVRISAHWIGPQFHKRSHVSKFCHWTEAAVRMAKTKLRSLTRTGVRVGIGASFFLFSEIHQSRHSRRSSNGMPELTNRKMGSCLSVLIRQLFGFTDCVGSHSTRKRAANVATQFFFLRARNMKIIRRPLSPWGKERSHSRNGLFFFFFTTQTKLSLLSPS